LQPAAEAGADSPEERAWTGFAAANPAPLRVDHPRIARKTRIDGCIRESASLFTSIRGIGGFNFGFRTESLLPLQRKPI
jgi:hypothetical protein